MSSIVKAFIMIIFLTWSPNVWGRQAVIKIANDEIFENQLRCSDDLAKQLFMNKNGFPPSAKDQKELNLIKYHLKLYQLQTALTDIILRHLEKIYFDEVVPQTVIDDFLQKNQKNIVEDMKHDRLFLKAHEELMALPLSSER